MKQLRRLILALGLMAGIAPAFAQVPAAVPALPDTERRTSYAITASTCSCNVNFALYGDSTDYQNWVEVFINGVRYDYNDASHGWAITSPSGPLSSLARPVTNAVLTFTAAQTGTVQIVGARRPRRASQFAENAGVSARNLNQVFTDIISQNREIWDKTNDVTGRAILAPPGETLRLLAVAATRASTVLGFDALGNTTTYSPASAVTSSASVTFLQSGTGATARTVQEELRNVVKAEQFGMVCNGSTDVGPALQRAITEADARGGVPVILPEGTCALATSVFLNKTAAAGILTVPGLKIKGQGKGVTILDTRVANGYAIAVNPAWKVAHQALAGITATTGGSGALATTTYYVQITVSDPLGNQVNVTSSKSIAVTGPTGRIAITLPSTNPGYAFNIYLGTTSTPANFAVVGGVNASGLGGGQSVNLDAIGSAQVIPTALRAVWQNADISDLSITNSTAVAAASGILYFKAGYANLTNVEMKGLTGDGFVVPDYTGDIDGSFNVTVDKSKFDTIAGWCIDASGLALELSNFSVDNTVFNLCGTATSGLGVAKTILSITNGVTPIVTTSTSHSWQAGDQIYISGVAGMTLANGWYRVGTAVAPTNFNLTDLNGQSIDTTSLGAYTASSGSGSLAWRPPTSSTGSGGIRWLGLIGAFKNGGCTQANNVCLFAAENGASDNLTIERFNTENTAGKGIYIASVVGGSLVNSECLSATSLGATISCVQLGTGTAGGGVQNFAIDRIKVRSDVTTATAFEQFQNTNNTGAFSDSNRVRNITWQSFDLSAAQKRFDGFTFDPIPGQIRFSISAANTAKLIPIGYGGALPLHLQANGEWVAYQVPVAGITGAVTGGLSATTSYNCYGYNSAATSAPYVISFECNATATALDKGYLVKSGDATRTFIGTATTDGSGNFQTVGAQSSWYPPGGGSSVGVGGTNQVAWYTAASTINGLATANNGTLVTSPAGVPSISSTLPNAVQDNLTRLGIIASGTWNGTVVAGTYGGTGVNNGVRTITLGGNVTTAAALVQAGAFATTITSTATTNSTLPAGTHTLAGLDVAQAWTTSAQTFGSGILKIGGATSGAITINCASTCGTPTLTLPAGTTDFSATGGASQVVKQTSAGGAFTVAQLAMADISDGATLNATNLTTGTVNAARLGFAVKADLQTPSSTTLIVNPRDVQDHPGVAKFWMRADGKGGSVCTIGASYNVASCVRNSTGNYTVTFTTAFANANYIVSGSAWQVGVSSGIIEVSAAANFTTTAVTIGCYNTTTAAAMDCDIMSVQGFGSQ